MATVAAAIAPLDIRALLLKGAVCSAMTRQGLRARDARWEWDGEYPEPCLRVTAVIVRWATVEIRAEELRVSGFDQNIPEGTVCADDAEVAATHTVTLERSYPGDVDSENWWDCAAFDAFGLGRFGDVVLADEPRNIVTVEVEL
jgi:hypothetical protein